MNDKELKEKILMIELIEAQKERYLNEITELEQQIKKIEKKIKKLEDTK